MHVICLGSGGYFSTGDALTMSFLIPELRIVLDGGSGLHRAAEHIGDGETIHIFLSHAHIDHTVGLTSMKRLGARVCIHATQQVLDALEVLLRPPFVGSHPEYEAAPLPEQGPVRLENGATVTPFDVEHTCPCKGFRVDFEGAAVCFITDTCSDGKSKYLEYARGVDMLLHECYALETRGRGHTGVQGLVEFVRAASPKRTLVVHHNPSGTRHEILSGLRNELTNIDDAEDGKEYEVCDAIIRCKL